MNMKYLLAIFIFLAVMMPFASAATMKVGYVLRNPTAYYTRPVAVLQSMGYTVDFIKNINVKSVDWTKYDFMVVQDDYYYNAVDFPVNKVKSLLFSTKHMKTWGWSSSISYMEKNSPLVIYNAVPGHLITTGMDDTVQIYDRCCYSNSLGIKAYFLSHQNKAPSISAIVTPIEDNRDGVISTVLPGALLKDGTRAVAKGAFYGIREYTYWTADSETLFRNTVRWLVTDTEAPVISAISVSDITETAAKVLWTTNKDANSKVEYGITTSLGSTAADAGYSLSHSMQLSGLAAKTKYYYKITSCNRDGYCASSAVLEFSTVDLTAPSILALGVSDITDKTAKATVDVNENAKAVLKYGTSAGNLVNTLNSDVFKLSHVFSLSGLSDHTTYYYQARVCDLYNNCMDSEIKSFTTFDYTPPGAPVNLRETVVNSNRHVIVDWDAPADLDVALYNIYIADAPDSFSFTTPSATATDTQWEDAAAQDHKQRFYIVRAKDGSGNEETNTNKVGKYDINIIEGENLVSLPLQPFSNTVAEVMHQTTSFYPVEEVKRMANGAYEATVFNPSTGNWEGFSEMKTGDGYFFSTTQDFIFTQVGRPVSGTKTKQLLTGANLIGWTSLQSISLLQAVPQTSVNHPVNEIFSYSGPEYISATFYPENSPSYWSFCASPFKMEPGKGYVFKASEDLTWTYE